jgi:hypothetical protein
MYSTASTSNHFPQLGEKITELYGLGFGIPLGMHTTLENTISRFYGKLKPDLSVYGAFLRKTCANRDMVNEA